MVLFATVNEETRVLRTADRESDGLCGDCLFLVRVNVHFSEFLSYPGEFDKGNPCRPIYSCCAPEV